jgi:2'-5' RNA ligase
MKMRTAIALLVDDDFANRLTPFTLRCRDYGFNLRALRLPAHVSLKQPFVVNDFEQFEEYFKEFAGRGEPQQLKFDGFVFWGDAEEGGIAAHIVESTRLRQLHSQLNAELEQAFGETQADYDGDAYRFHLTVAIGACHADVLSKLHADVANWKLDEITLSSRLAMFIYEESARTDSLYGVREFGTYNILPLRQKNAHL